MRAEIHYRYVLETDVPLLFEIYRCTRLHELDAVNWSDEQKQLFLQMQFDIQHRHYQQIYDRESFRIILLGDTAVGRLYINDRLDEIHIVDIALLPQHQGAGTGTRVLYNVIEQARQHMKTVSIHVEKNNPALRLYQRLGFVVVADTGVHWRMHRQTVTNKAIQ